jgi:hypothetical protein
MNRTDPNCASFKLKVLLMVGILAAQEEKVVPLRKKKAPTANR